MSFQAEQNIRCLSCGYLVQSPHLCDAKSIDHVGVEIERACMRVKSPLTGRDYTACFVMRTWHGLSAESVMMSGESVE